MTLKAMLLPTFNGQAGPSNASSTGPSRRKLISLAVACSAAYFVWTLAVPGVSGDEATPSPDGGSTPAQVAGQSRWTSWGWASPSKWGSGTHDAHHTTPLSGGLTADPSTWESPTRPLPLEASLDERLRSWSDAPIPEPADWVRFSLNTCPEKRIGKNGNYELLKKSHLLWSSINATHVREKRDELISYLRRAEAEGRLSEENWGTGRGLVFTAGNADTFSRVALTLRMFREHLKVGYPAEIFSFPGEEPDAKTREILENLKASLHTITDLHRDETRTKNFHIKASALVRSSFREPLYLDSDNLPAVINPGEFERLWESRGYRKLGMLAWPDYWKTHADVPVWLLIGTQCRDEWEQEAGQILVDKSKHLDALLLSEFMLKDWKYWFNFSDGDKDIFRYAMLALRKRWALPGRYLGAGGLSWDTLTGYCGHTMLQHDAFGRPLFVHQNLLKQIPSGVYRGSTWKRTKSVRLVPEDPAADEVLEDWAVEADMLANAQLDGTAIMPAPEMVRRRAALELGLRPFLHGGSVSAVCADIDWSDPRTDEEIETYKAHWLAAHNQTDSAADSTSSKATPQKPDISYTEADDGFRVKWESPVELLQWNDDERLASFEDRFFDMGGKTNGDGF